MNQPDIMFADKLRDLPPAVGRDLLREGEGRLVRVAEEERNELYRNDKAAQGKEVYRISISSDEPYEFRLWRGFKVIETLRHTKSAVDLGRMNDGAQILWNHNRDEYIGVSLRAWVDGGRAYCDFVFDKHDNARKIKDSVDSGILRNVSIGYKIHDEKSRIDNEGTDDEVMRIDVKRWEIMELSIVTVPADKSVGFGRSRSDYIKEFYHNHNQEAKMEKAEKPEEGTREAEVQTAPVRADGDAALAQIANAMKRLEERQAAMEKKGEERSAEIDAQKAELERRAGIEAQADMVKNLPHDSLSALRKKALDDGAVNAEQFGKMVSDELERIQKEEPENVQFRSNLGLSAKDVNGYSINNLVECLLEGKRGIEIEMGEEIAARKGEDAVKTRKGANGTPLKNIVVPWDVLCAPGKAESPFAMAQRKLEEAERERASVSTGSGSGGTLIGTDHLAGSFLNVLLGTSVMARQVRTWTGLQGILQIPTLTNSVTWARVAEGADRGTNNPVFGEKTLNIKTSGGGVPITRRLLQQGTPNAQAVLMENMARTAALHMDSQLLFGSGSGENSTGVANETGITSLTYEAFDGTGTYSRYADLGLWLTNKMYQKFMESYTFMGMRSWIISPLIWHQLASLEKFPGTDGTPLLAGNGKTGTLNGFPYYCKEDGMGNKMFFGNWQDLLMGIWEMLSISVDTTTNAASGTIVVRGWMDFNSVVLRAKSFGMLNTA